MLCGSDNGMCTTPPPPVLEDSYVRVEADGSTTTVQVVVSESETQHQHRSRPPRPTCNMEFEHHSVLAMYKTGNSVRQVTVGYGSDNDVMLREERHLNESCSCSESDTDGSRRGRIVFTRITPPNMEGTRLPTPAGGREFVVERRPMKKAGVRRKRRWMNDYFIDEQYTKLLPKDVDEARREWLRLHVPDYNSQFRELFEDDNCMAAFDAYIDIDMDAEEHAIAALERASRSARASSKQAQRAGEVAAAPAEPSPVERYRQLPRHMRNAVRQAACVRSSIRESGRKRGGTGKRKQVDEGDVATVLEHVEEILLDLVDRTPTHGDARESLAMQLPDSFHRLVWHSVAAYHNLTSYSRQSGAGQRTSFARTRRVTVQELEEMDPEMLAAVLGRCSLEPTLPGSRVPHGHRLSNVIERLLAQHGGNWVSEFESAAGAPGAQVGEGGQNGRARRYRKARGRPQRRAVAVAGEC